MSETDDKLDRYEYALQQIDQWIDAYPLKIFPEPDLKKARSLLEAGGMTLDAVSASNMRHVLKGLRGIVDGALSPNKDTSHGNR